MSARARLTRISIHPDGNVVVTVPRIFNRDTTERLIAKHADWIERKIKIIKKRTVIWADKKNIAIYKKQAAVLVRERCEYFSKLYGVTPEKISIRTQKSRWGSCSRKGNLSFNYQIVLLPPQLADQVIVHELCHLLEFNHSPKFWSLVAREIPDYKAVRKELKMTTVRFR